MGVKRRGLGIGGPGGGTLNQGANHHKEKVNRMFETRELEKQNESNVTNV